MSPTSREEIEEYAQYLASQGANPNEIEEYKAYLYEQSGINKDKDVLERAKDGALSALDYGLRGLDYAGGLTRTAAAQIADPFTENDVVTGDDWKRALVGKAPSTAEFMDRAGIPEGASIDLNPFAEGETSVRDLVGFAGDIVLDPLTYISLGTAGTAKSGLNAAGRALQKGGKAVYKSGLKAVDQDVVEKGAKPVSDVLFKNRVSGTVEQVRRKSDEIKKDLSSKREALYDQADALGVKVNPSAAVQRAKEITAKMRENPGKAELADRFDEFIRKYEMSGPIDVRTASDWKTSFYDALPDSAFDRVGKLKGDAKKVHKALGRGFKEEIETAGELGQKGLGGSVESINQDWGSLLAADKPLSREAKKAKRKNMVSSVDAGLAGYAVADPLTGSALLGAKKLGDLSKTTFARTKTGLALDSLGQSGLIDPAIRQLLIEQNRSPWMSMKEDQ